MPTQTQQPDNLRASVIDRFRKVATAPEQERRFPIGPMSAKRLGYDPAEIASLPSSVTESFCGVRKPFLLGQPLPDHRVLDLGCGAGFDTLLAAQRVGPNGKVIGIEMTPEMLAGAIPKCRYAAVRLECFFVDGCVDISSPSSSAFNSARHAGGSQRHSVFRSLAIASRV